MAELTIKKSPYLPVKTSFKHSGDSPIQTGLTVFKCSDLDLSQCSMILEYPRLEPARKGNRFPGRAAPKVLGRGRAAHLAPHEWWDCDQIGSLASLTSLFSSFPFALAWKENSLKAHKKRHPGRHDRQGGHTMLGKGKMRKQRGFGALQVLLSIAGVVAVTAVAVPKYQDFTVRSKMSEAFAIVGDTKNKLTEFYIMKNRFPRTANELDTMQTDLFSAPGFVDKVEVKGNVGDNEVMIQVFFQAAVIPGDGFNDQYFYIAGNSGGERGSMLQWSCGLEGIDEKYMPSRCID
ncbi:MAG: type IV pilus assembly protein PilA [Bacteroidia bacterium]